MIVARKPEAIVSPCQDETIDVVYKGPAAAISLDSGTTLVRGRRTPISTSEFAALASPGLSKHVVALERVAAACG